MPVAMMGVREMWMRMHDRFVTVPMGMSRPRSYWVRVFVLVVFVMDMRVCMFKLFVNVLVFVPLGNV